MSENQAVWYLPGSDNQPDGPHTTDHVQELCREGKVYPNTLCWQEGMSDWMPLSQVQPFCEILPRTPDVTEAQQAELQGFEDLGKMFGKAMSLTVQHVQNPPPAPSRSWHAYVLTLYNRAASSYAGGAAYYTNGKAKVFL